MITQWSWLSKSVGSDACVKNHPVHGDGDTKALISTMNHAPWLHDQHEGLQPTIDWQSKKQAETQQLLWNLCVLQLHAS